MKAAPRILISRTDHLGDVLLSLKALWLIRKTMPEATLRFVVQDSVAEVIAPFCRDHQIECEGLKKGSWRKEPWDLFLALHCDYPFAWDTFKKRIPIRVGQKKHFWSYLLFNQGMRQKRTLTGKHESDYSVELARVALSALNRETHGWKKGEEAIELPLEPQKQRAAQKALAQLGINPGDAFVVIHPGMAGSALNLSPRSYGEIIRLLKSKIIVVLSVGPSEKDQEIWGALSQELPDLKKLPSMSLGVLKEVYRMSQGVIAPSTGPIHLAHLVGVPVIGLYSPVPTQHPRRWKPTGGRVSAQVFLPSVQCPAKKECWGEKCEFYPCMDKAPWTDLILGAVSDLTKSYAK